MDWKLSEEEIRALACKFCVQLVEECEESPTTGELCVIAREAMRRAKVIAYQFKKSMELAGGPTGT